MADAVTAYIGLGSNLDNPRSQVQTALQEVDSIPATRLVKASALYKSAPMGPKDQPDYINAVAAIETSLEPEMLLTELQQLEASHQRVREEHWGPRTLDLDLLLYGNAVIHSEHLTVPHPGLKERNFVLIPLYEIAPDLRLPDNQILAELVKTCSREGLQRLENQDQ